MSAGLDKFMKLPPSELGTWEDRYKNLKPNVRRILDKIMRSELFKKQAKAAGGADKELDSFWHWRTSVSNAHDYTEPAVITNAEVSTVAEIFSKPWRVFERPWWEKDVREVVLPEFTKMVPKSIDDPDKLLGDINAGRYVYGYFPEDVESWVQGKEHYAPSIYEGERLANFIHGDINDGTAVCGFTHNTDYYFVRTYTSSAVMKLVHEMPQELKPYLVKANVETPTPSGVRQIGQYEFVKPMRREAAVDKILEIIKKLEDDYGGVAPLREVKLRAGAEGISESFVEQIILEEKKLGHLYEPKIDMISMAITQPRVSPRFELGDYVRYGGRVMVFGGVKDGTILLKDPFYPKGEYDLTVTKKEFEDLRIPSRGYVTSEYERLEEKKPADFEMRLAKLPVAIPEEEEEEEEEIEEEEAEKPPKKEVKGGVYSFSVKVEVTGRYNIELERGEFHSLSERRSIREVEDYVNPGKTEIDMYEALRSVGGDYHMILKGLHDWEFYTVPELAEFYRKVEEERWDEITEDEESRSAKAWEHILASEWVVTWTPADVKWSPEAARDREIYHSKFRYDELVAMRADELANIARVKGLPIGRKEEMAKAIHQFDYGAEEAKSKLSEIEKLLG